MSSYNTVPVREQKEKEKKKRKREGNKFSTLSLQVAGRNLLQRSLNTHTYLIHLNIPMRQVKLKVKFENNILITIKHTFH